jgi:ubiquitin-protein ligase E3 A
LQKEFFQLIIKEIFNPDFGMFILEQETRSYYFRSLSNELREFELIGTILGLAIYNGVILDIHFPDVVYKKLMGRETTIKDLEMVSPELYQGMKTLLAFDGNVEEVYARDFSIEVDNFGVKDVVELKADGKNTPLTSENKEEYVELFVDYQLNKSVAKQFNAFKKGFDLVVNGPAFALFTPEELELVVCGEQVLDFDELEKAAEYESEEDFGPDHEVVKWFWECVRALSDENKKKLLHFSTGSDRAPIGGLKNLHLIIQRHGDGDERLPSSHTCFNHLLLPQYTTKEALSEKLMLALENSMGFGMI